MNGIIDYHSHILPGVDDGSSSVEESLAMLKAEASQGICSVVATPHFYADQDSLEHFIKRRASAENRLRDVIPDYDGFPEIILGAEVYFFSGISAIDSLKELAIAKSKCILIEMPQCKWTPKMYHELEQIYVNHGLTPIIAHVDRYISPFQTHGIPERLSDLPVLVQANASFFLNRWTKNMGFRMLKNGQIHLLGSDCHNMRSRRPRLGEAVSAIQKHHKNILDVLDNNSQYVFDDALSPMKPY